MNNKKKNVVIFANNDWNEYWYQRQQYAIYFASLNFNVFYINRTLQRLPNLSHLYRRLKNYKSNKKTGTIDYQNINIVTLFLLPPVKWLRVINRFIIKLYIKKIPEIQKPLLFITYVPTYNTLDFINIINPLKIVYVNVHNYDDSDYILHDLLMAEKELISIADVLFADSSFNKERIRRKAKNKKVFSSLPGVNYNNFKQAYRGDEHKRNKTLYYYGRIKSDLDLSLYNELSLYLKIVFIGDIHNEVKNNISSNIEIRPPVTYEKLPHVLKDADMIGLFYNDTNYNKGIIPAKFFECLATKKPILISGLKETLPYSDIVYQIDGSIKKALQVIANLKYTESKDVLNKRDKIAKEADWPKRFYEFFSIINNC